MGAKITASNAAHLPSAPTPEVASARNCCASSRSMPASFATRVICGPADRTPAGPPRSAGHAPLPSSHSAPDLVHLVLDRPGALRREHAQQPQQQHPVRPQLAQQPVRPGCPVQPVTTISPPASAASRPANLGQGVLDLLREHRIRSIAVIATAPP